MLNIIIPIYEPDDLDNKSLEILDSINNKTMFAWSLEHLEKYQENKRYYIISTDNLISQTYIDKIIKLHTDSEIKIIRLQKNTSGAPCAILMGIDFYNLDEEFLITSPDQYLDTNLQDHINLFRENNSIGGSIGFKSIQTKWSYAEINKQNFITRIEEKIPISNNALTSTYYFSKGKYMIEALSKYILRGELTNNKYYIAPSFNELIVSNHNVYYSSISSNKYYNFFSEAIKKNFVDYINAKEDILVKITEKYFEVLKEKIFEDIDNIFLKNIELYISENENYSGIIDAKSYYEKNYFLLDNSQIIMNKVAKYDNETTFCNYYIKSTSIELEILDKIYFDTINNKIKSIKRFSYKSE